MAEKLGYWQEAAGYALPLIFMQFMIALDEVSYMQLNQISMTLAERQASTIIGDIGNALVLAAIFGIAKLARKETQSIVPSSQAEEVIPSQQLVSSRR